MEWSYAEIPEDMHQQLQADVLLTDKSLSAAANLLSLVQPNSHKKQTVLDHYTLEVQAAATAEISTNIGEYIFAIDKLLSDVVVATRTLPAARHGTAYGEIVGKYVDGLHIPLDDTTLNEIVRRLVTTSGYGKKRTEILSPFLSVWANRLKQDGRPPDVTLEWPYNEQKNSLYYLGKGMQGVNLTLLGRFRGRIGENAEDCVFTLQDANGQFGHGSQNCHFNGLDLIGRFLHDAKRGGISCDRITTPVLHIGNGFSISANVAECDMKPARDYFDDGEEAQIFIEQLTGEVEMKPGWIIQHRQ